METEITRLIIKLTDILHRQSKEASNLACYVKHWCLEFYNLRAAILQIVDQLCHWEFNMQ